MGEAIREFLAERLQRGLKTPGVGFCTITGVDVTADLRQARAYVSVYGDAAERNRTLEGLARAAGYLRGEIGRALRLKFAPELEFRYDESIERGARVDAVLREALAQDRALAVQRGEPVPANTSVIENGPQGAEGEGAHGPDTQPSADSPGGAPGTGPGR